jgi:hypothetical protein
LDWDPIEPVVVYEIRGFGSFIRMQAEHWSEEGGDGVCFFFREEVLIV